MKKALLLLVIICSVFCACPKESEEGNAQQEEAEIQIVEVGVLQDSWKTIQYDKEGTKYVRYWVEVNGKIYEVGWMDHLDCKWNNGKKCKVITKSNGNNMVSFSVAERDE